MPLIEEKFLKPPRYLDNAHVQTVFGSLVRRVKGVTCRRERIETPDEDFIDLDWSDPGNRRLVILTHGLEGSSQKPYMLGMMKALNEAGWDALSWNFRSCSGVMNRKKIFYHAGVTWDLETVISHAEKQNRYREIALVGFSLGASLTLRYLGEQGSAAKGRISKAAAISVPVDLVASSRQINEGPGWMYGKAFLIEFKRKLRAKAKLMPGEFDLSGVDEIETMREFDNRFTAPIHGYKGWEDFYIHTGCKAHLPEIKLPTLVLNSADDPIIADTYFPTREALESGYLHLEITDKGGHVGFFGMDSNYGEEKVVRFFKNW